MTPGRRWSPVRACLLAAGACDLATGALLLAAPALALAALSALATGLGAAPLPVPAEPVYLRLVGAFVAGVGASYLYPFLPGMAARPGRLAAVAAVTALVRGSVALFLAAAVAVDALAAGWLVVAAVDGGLAAAQALLLAKGWIADA
ncbi:MAG TPA: hypothetical protein VF150_11170 [Thermoanaerobaculia bacterium]